jgi:hypothetical protein
VTATDPNSAVFVNTTTDKPTERRQTETEQKGMNKTNIAEFGNDFFSSGQLLLHGLELIHVALREIFGIVFRQSDLSLRSVLCAGDTDANHENT